MGVLIQIDGTGRIHGCKINGVCRASGTNKQGFGLVGFENTEHVQRDRRGITYRGFEMKSIMTVDENGERVPVEWTGVTRDQGRENAVPYLSRIVVDYYHEMMMAEVGSRHQQFCSALGRSAGFISAFC
jgi:ABC-type histidine transport system ATPase subunit